MFRAVVGRVKDRDGTPLPAIVVAVDVPQWRGTRNVSYPAKRYWGVTGTDGRFAVGVNAPRTGIFTVRLVVNDALAIEATPAGGSRADIELGDYVLESYESMATVIERLVAHLARRDNPHEVMLEQLGGITASQVAELLTGYLTMQMLNDALARYQPIGNYAGAQHGHPYAPVTHAHDYAPVSHPHDYAATNHPHAGYATKPSPQVTVATSTRATGTLAVGLAQLLQIQILNNWQSAINANAEILDKIRAELITSGVLKA